MAPPATTIALCHCGDHLPYPDTTSTDQRHPLNGHLGVVPLLKSRKSCITCTEPVNTTAKAARKELLRERFEPMDVSVHLNISADEHLPADTDKPGQPLGTHTMAGQEYTNEPETCDCSIRQTMRDTSLPHDEHCLLYPRPGNG